MDCGMSCVFLLCYKVFVYWLFANLNFYRSPPFEKRVVFPPNFLVPLGTQKKENVSSSPLNPICNQFWQVFNRLRLLICLNSSSENTQGGKKAKNKDRQLMLKQTKTHTKPTSQQNWIQMKEVESILFNYGKTVPCLSPFPIIFSTMWGALLRLCIGTKNKKVVMSLLSVCSVFFNL